MSKSSLGEELRPSLLLFFFSPEGRMNALQFFVGIGFNLLLIHACFILATKYGSMVGKGTNAHGETLDVILCFAMIVLLFSCMCMTIKRWHDHGITFWATILTPPGPFARALLVTRLVLAGDQDINEFGQPIETADSLPRFTGAGAILFAGMLAVVAAGLLQRNRPQSQSQPDVASADENQETQVEPVPPPAKKIEQPKRASTISPGDFEQAATADAQSFGIKAFDVGILRAQQKAQSLVKSPLLLDVGQQKDVGPLRVQAQSVKIPFQRGASRAPTDHMIVHVTNVSRQPLAYKINASLAGNRTCPARGTIKANYLALAPKESAQLSICPGRDKVEIHELRTMTLSALGYEYISMLPPTALGLDHFATLAHRVSSSCTNISAAKLINALRLGTLAWEDIVDFYSRHSCMRHSMPLDYRHTEDPLDVLPFGAAHP